MFPPFPGKNAIIPDIPFELNEHYFTIPICTISKFFENVTSVRERGGLLSAHEKEFH